MSETAEKIKEQAARLPVNERADLAYFLLHSLDAEESEADVYAAWVAELDRRWARIEAGQARGIPAKEAIAKARDRTYSYRNASIGSNRDAFSAG